MTEATYLPDHIRLELLGRYFSLLLRKVEAARWDGRTGLLDRLEAALAEFDRTSKRVAQATLHRPSGTGWPVTEKKDS